jgi:predicted nucleotidyltransferase
MVEANMAPSLNTSDPVLSRVHQALRAMYGSRLERVILYGSRARGDARPDSDYDVAVFLFDMGSRNPGPELWRMAGLESAVIDETGMVVHAMPYQAGSYAERTPLMREIRREGIEL